MIMTQPIIIIIIAILILTPITTVTMTTTLIITPAILHPLSVRRFPSFRTQPLESLSHYL